MIRARGPYKRYFSDPDPEANKPKSTLYNRRQRRLADNDNGKFMPVTLIVKNNYLLYAMYSRSMLIRSAVVTGLVNLLDN